MKLTPWLRSLKTGLSRVFHKAKVKRRVTHSASAGLMSSGACSEELEDRVLLAVFDYRTGFADGTYAKGVLLQTSPASPITLPADLNGQPAIKFTVFFDSLVSVDVNLGRPLIYFNTASNDPNAPNYPGSTGIAVYEGPSVVGVSVLDFYYVIQNGENTPGPLQPDATLTVTGGANFGLTGANMNAVPNGGTIHDIFNPSFEKHIYIDTTPIVQDVNAAPAATIDSLPYNDDPNAGVLRRPYRVGDPPIEITVQLSEPVVITGTPTLQLNIINSITGQNATAVYVSGSGTSVLHYLYTVSPGDNTNDLDVASSTPFLLTNSTLKDQDFIPDDPTGYIANQQSGLSTVGPSGVIPGILGQHRAIQVDTTTPLVGPAPGQTTFTGVTAQNANGTYGIGQTIRVKVQFNEAIVLTGTPSLLMQTSANVGVATFAGLEGVDTLLFDYVVRSGDSTADLDYLNPNALQLNGGSLTDLAGNAAVLTLPAPGAAGSLSANKNIKIDTNLAVTNVTTTLPNGSYGVGQVIPIQIQFNSGKTVNVIGTPQLILKLDSPTNSVVVDYSSGSGTNILTFLYTIQDGHNAADLDYLSADALQLNGGSILDGASGGAAILTLPLPGSQGSLGFNKNIAIDSVRPNIVTVSASSSIPNGTYVQGQVIPITVTFSEPVSVTGVPQIILETNGIPGVQLAGALQPGEIADAVVNYSSGSGTNTLTFNYTIGRGQNSLDLEALELLLSNGSLIKDLGGNNLYDAAAVGNVFPLPQLATEHMTASNSTANLPGVAKIETLLIGFGTPTVGETYRVNVTTVDGTFNASYTVTALDTASDVAQKLRQQIQFSAIGNRVNVTGSSTTIQLTAKVAGVDFTVNSTTVIPVPPGVVPNGTFTHSTTRANVTPVAQEDVITIFSPAVGTIFDLTINGTAIRYDSTTTDPAVAAAAIATLINQKLPTAVDAVANANQITLTSKIAGAPVTISVLHALASLRDIIVNTAPVITNIDSPNTEVDNPYSAADNDVIYIDVTFSEPVFVDTTFGTPRLILETNGVQYIQLTPSGGAAADAIAAYDSGTGTNTLRFKYTVGPNDTSVDLDVGVTMNANPALRTSTLQLNGGFITDAVVNGKALDPLLPAPGAAGSLSANRTLQIDSVNNDPPVNQVPGTQTMVEDQLAGLVFSVANGNAITIADVDSTASLTVTLTTGPAGRGTLTLPIETGLVVTGNGTSTLTLTGTLGLINSRLDGLTFQPAANDNSSVVPNIQITVSTSDNGSGPGPLVDTDIIPITVTAVNDVPVALNQTLQTPVGQSLTIGLSVNDPDGPSQTYTINQANKTPHGVLSPIFGSNQVIYTPDPGYVGPDSFSFSSFDGIATSSNTATITINVVPVVTLTGFPDISVLEGNSGLTPATFTVTLSHAAVQDVVIEYQLVSDTAVAGLDYQDQPGTQTLTIPAGQTSGTIVVGIIGDLADEPNKRFSVELTDATNAVLLDTTAFATIVNDDGLSISGVTKSEGQNGLTDFTFTVTLSTVSISDVSVSYRTLDGTAIAGSDYISQTGNITIPAGSQSQTVTISVKGDTLNEQDETFLVELYSPIGSSLGQFQATGTITNDDNVPTYSINNVTVDEGSANDTVFANFTVTLSAASGQVVTVNYTTQDSTAIAVSDYVATSGTLTFQPGETTKTISVRIVGDKLVEGDDTFNVLLTSGTNADPAPNGAALGTGTIRNDDGLSISDGFLREGDSGQSFMVFTVTAPQSGGQTVSVNYSTVAVTATAGVDFTPVSGTLVFSGGVTTKTISVPILGDFIQEGDETFQVVLSNELNAPVLKRDGEGVIQDNDLTPAISSSNIFLSEPTSGSVLMTFTLTLDHAVGVPVTVDYSTFDITATAGLDYISKVGTVTFDPFQTSKTVSVQIQSDPLDEFSETFGLHLSNPVNATIAGDDPIGTIGDIDPAPSLIFNDISINESNGTATVNVSLSAPSGKVITLNYATEDITAIGTNIPGNNSSNDYVAQTGTLTFQPGVTSQDIVITINSDLLYERDETFAIALSNLVNVDSVVNRRTVTIVNDDAAPTAVINDVTVTEGDVGTTAATFTVSLLQPSALPATVSYSTSSGSAQLGTDFQNASGTITFAPGETTKTITINVNGDSAVESNETFQVNLLSNAVNATIGDNLGVGTITNDDFLPSLQVNNVQVTEGNSGTKELTFTVTRVGSTASVTTVAISTSNGTATANSDYVGISNTTLVFGIGEIEKTVTVLINGDLTPEQNETFFLNLSTPVNALITPGLGQGVGTILTDDNFPPVVTMPVGPLTVNEETNIAITGIQVTDADIGGGSMDVTLSASNGTIVVRNDVVNGATNIFDNGTGTVRLTGTIAQINATLAASNAVIYRGNTDYFGSDALMVTANDNGFGGTDTKAVVLNVLGVNDDPALEFEGNGGGNPSQIPSTKGTPVAAFGSPNALDVSDSDNLNFNGGTITVTNLSNISQKDKLSIRNQGTGSGQIGFKRNKLTYNGQVIGTVSGGTKGSPLVITLNDKASIAATEALMRNITFSTARARLSAVPRTISMVLTDGQGGVSNTIQSTVNVTN